MKTAAQPQDKYVLRLPDGMRDELKDAAGMNGRSMNAEIVDRLERSFRSRGVFLKPDLAKHALKLPVETLISVFGEAEEFLNQKTQAALRSHDLSQLGLVGQFLTMIEDAPRAERNRLIADLDELMRRAGVTLGSPLYSRGPDGLNLGYMRWDPKTGKWQSIQPEVWAILAEENVYAPGIDGTCEGANHFVALVFDDEGNLLNVVPRFFKLDVEGSVIGDAFSEILNADERAEHRKITEMEKPSKKEAARLKQLQAAVSARIRPPTEALVALRALLTRNASVSTVDSVLAKTVGSS